MPSRITTRFFRVLPFAPETPLFTDCLADIHSVSILKDRFRNAGSEDGQDMQVRLERLTPGGDLWPGEFTRLQSEDVPATVTADGLVPTDLQDGLGLGHCAAFVYHQPTRVMAMQINTHSVSHISTSGYLHAFKAPYQYVLEPVPVEDTWAAFTNSKPRKLEISIASPENLAAIEGNADDPVIDNFRRFGEILGGHVITVEVSVGRKQDVTLPKAAVGAYIRRFLGMKKKGKADVRKVKVTSDEKNSVGEYQEINFLKEFLQEKEELNLPNDNSDQNYKLRAEAVKRAMTKHQKYLTDLFAQ